MSGYEETENYRVNFLQRIAIERPSLTTGRFGYYYPDTYHRTFRLMVSWFFTFILVVAMAAFFVVWFMTKS